MSSATHVSVFGHEVVSAAPVHDEVVVTEQWNFVTQTCLPPMHSPTWFVQSSPTPGSVPSSMRPLQSLSLPSQISVPPLLSMQPLPLPLPSMPVPPSPASSVPPPSPLPPSPREHSRQ